MHLGLALPQYDYSVAGERPLRYSTVADYARRAEASGFASVWLSDHVFLDLAKYGGDAEPSACYEPVVTLAALARTVTRIRLGTLVLCEALRPASVLTKALTTLDHVADGRLDVGIGAGWYEPDYTAIGMTMPPPGERLARLGEALDVLSGLFSGGPLTYDGRFHRASGATNMPAARQRPRPRVFVGGKGDRLLRLVAERADGWNTCWIWTTEAYRERLRVLEAACESVNRDPASVWRTLGLYALVGENQRDLERRFDRLRDTSPSGVVQGDLEQFRAGRLVGTVEQVHAQLEHWRELGIETLIANVGAVPFQVSGADDVELVAAALRP
jgi:alkanesulfonate monooxygenase SsuD/methylene tetrahydromethanopterin reductase-like flavin-dependent oxidoreductase (luciferase family)